MKMSESESDEQIVEPFCWRPRQVHSDARCLFRTYSGKPLEFAVYDDLISKQRIEGLIISYGGSVDVTHIRPTSIVLAREDSRVPVDNGPVYSRLFVRDCIVAFTLLDLDKYLVRHCPVLSGTKIITELFHDRFTFRSFSRPILEFFEETTSVKKYGDKVSGPKQNVKSVGAAEVTDVRNNNKVIETPCCSIKPNLSAEMRDQQTNSLTPFNNNRSSSDSDDGLPEAWKHLKKPKSTVPSKHTRQRFSRAEKEAILRHIVATKSYHRLSSDALYKEMEMRDVCPHRTYQSLKNHFLKTLINELDTFTFLTESHKRSLRGQRTQL